MKGATKRGRDGKRKGKEREGGLEERAKEREKELLFFPIRRA